MVTNGKRFEVVYLQGDNRCGIEIWVDKETGVHYLWNKNLEAGGMTVLVDRDGKPVVTN